MRRCEKESNHVKPIISSANLEGTTPLSHEVVLEVQAVFWPFFWP